MLKSISIVDWWSSSIVVTRNALQSSHYTLDLEFYVLLPKCNALKTKHLPIHSPSYYTFSWCVDLLHIGQILLITFTQCVSFIWYLLNASVYFDKRPHVRWTMNMNRFIGTLIKLHRDIECIIKYGEHKKLELYKPIHKSRYLVCYCHITLVFHFGIICSTFIPN